MIITVPDKVFRRATASIGAHYEFPTLRTTATIGTSDLYPDFFSIYNIKNYKLIPQIDEFNDSEPFIVMWRIEFKSDADAAYFLLKFS